MAGEKETAACGQVEVQRMADGDHMDSVLLNLVDCMAIQITGSQNGTSGDHRVQPPYQGRFT